MYNYCQNFIVLYTDNEITDVLVKTTRNPFCWVFSTSYKNIIKIFLADFDKFKIHFFVLWQLLLNL